MSEQEPNRVSDNLGDVVSAGPAVANSPDAASGESAQGPAKETISADLPKIAPEQGEAGKAEAPKVETAKVEALEVEAPKADASKPDAPKADAPRIDAKADATTPSGRIMVMSRDHAWSGDSVGADKPSEAKSGLFGKRRVAALAAVIALAAAAGAIGGALATTGFGQFTGEASKAASSRAFEDTIARIDTEVAALRTSFEQASKHSASLLGKTNDRLDKVEKAQAEPAAKLTRLSEAVDKLRTASAPPALAPVAASAPVAAAPAAPPAPKETTASVQTANAAAAVPLPAPKPEVARLPTLEGWVLRDVANGSALIEGRQGMFEVYAGDQIPGLGRVDAVRKQDGHWVVVTSKGLIVAR